MDYVNELTNIPAANAVPDYVTNVDEVAYYINEGVERTFVGLENKIDYASKRYFQETGNSLVFNESGLGDGLKKIKDTITNALKKLWGYIKAAFEKVFNFIKKSCENFKKKINDAQFKRIKEGLKAKKPDLYLGIVHDYGELDKVLAGTHELVTFSKKMAANAQTALATVMTPKAKGEKATDKKAAEEEIIGVPYSAFNSLFKGVKDKNEATKKLTEELNGKPSTLVVRDVLAQFDIIKKFTVDYGANVKTAKKLFDTEKKIVADMQKTVNSAKNINASNFSKFLSKLSTVMTVTTNAACRSLASRHKEYAHIFKAATNKSTNLSKDDQKAQKNAAQTESATIDSLFDL